MIRGMVRVSNSARENGLKGLALFDDEIEKQRDALRPAEVRMREQPPAAAELEHRPKEANEFDVLFSHGNRQGAHAQAGPYSLHQTEDAVAARSNRRVWRGAV